jgi:hypothetical protein
MTCTKDIRVLIRSTGYHGENGVPGIAASKLEDMGLVLCDWYVNVTSSQRHNTSSCIYRVLVLKHLDDSVLFVWTVLVSTQVVEV